MFSPRLFSFPIRLRGPPSRHVYAIAVGAVNIIYYNAVEKKNGCQCRRSRDDDTYHVILLLYYNEAFAELYYSRLRPPSSVFFSPNTRIIGVPTSYIHL